MLPETPKETKQCPYCGETILKVAIVCRYCQHGLISDVTTQEVSTTDIRIITEQSKKLKDEVNKYMAAGWVVATSTNDSVQMVKRKKFDWILFIFLFVVGLITFFIVPLVYLLWWSVQKPQMVVLTVDKNLNILVNGVISAGPPKEQITALNFGFDTNPQTEEEKAAARKKQMGCVKVIGILFAILFVTYIIAVLVTISSHNYIPALMGF